MRLIVFLINYVYQEINKVKIFEFGSLKTRQPLWNEDQALVEKKEGALKDAGIEK